MKFLSSEIRIWRVAVLFVLLTAVIVAGLVTYERATRPIYYQLEYGMTMEQVVRIMGEPRVKVEDNNTSQWDYVFPRDARNRDHLLLYFRDRRLDGTGEKWRPWL